MPSDLIKQKIFKYYKHFKFLPKVKNTLKWHILFNTELKMIKPYDNSDHKNKTFEKQYDHIKRVYPYFWNIYSDKMMTNMIRTEYQNWIQLYSDHICHHFIRWI
jgi:hypothetical protein